MTGKNDIERMTKSTAAAEAQQMAVGYAQEFKKIGAIIPDAQVATHPEPWYNHPTFRLYAEVDMIVRKLSVPSRLAFLEQLGAEFGGCRMYNDKGGPFFTAGQASDWMEYPTLFGPKEVSLVVPVTDYLKQKQHAEDHVYTLGIFTEHSKTTGFESAYEVYVSVGLDLGQIFKVVSIGGGGKISGKIYKRWEGREVDRVAKQVRVTFVAYKTCHNVIKYPAGKLRPETVYSIKNLRTEAWYGPFFTKYDQGGEINDSARKDMLKAIDSLTDAAAEEIAME
jgi:hypothetical protein